MGVHSMEKRNHFSDFLKQKMPRKLTDYLIQTYNVIFGNSNICSGLADLIFPLADYPPPIPTLSVGLTLLIEF